MYCLYVHCDTRKQGEYIYEGIEYTFKYEPYYIGISHNSRRPYNFIHREKYVSDYAKKIINDGFYPESVILYDSIDKNEIGFLEIETMIKIGLKIRSNGPLINKSYKSVIVKSETAEKCRNSQKNIVTFIVCYPNGKIRKVTGLKNFCRINGLNYGNVCYNIYGKNNHVKGHRFKKYDTWSNMSKEQREKWITKSKRIIKVGKNYKMKNSLEH